MQFTIIYTRTLTLEETMETATQEEAERYAEKRAWESCELVNSDFDESETAFEVSEAVQAKSRSRNYPPVECPKPLRLSWGL